MNAVSHLYLTGCVYNETLAKEAVNAVAEVYADQCRVLGLENSGWRAEYSAGKFSALYLPIKDVLSS